MSRRAVRILLALAAWAAATALRAQAPAATGPELRVAAAEGAFPYCYRDPAGSWTGFGTEIFDAVARVMRLKFTRTGVSPQQQVERFRAGEFDVAQHLQELPQREEFADFSVPFLTLQGAIYVRKGGRIRRPEDLAGATFAVFSRNSVGENFLRARGLAPRIELVASPAEALAQIAAGRCDAVFVSQLTAEAIIARDKLGGVTMLGEPVEGFDVRHCFAVRKGDARLLARINEGLAILHRTGEFERIHRRWFGRVETRLFTREQVAIYVAAALALACAAALWGLHRQRVLRRRIAALNAELEARVAARTAELAGRVAEVERLNEELEAFSYSVSHDLRAPLRNITGFLELLARRNQDTLDPESARFLGIVTRESGRMGALIGDLLAFSRISRTELLRERVPLGELVAEVRRQLEPDLAGRAVEWRVGDLPAVTGDRTLLRQVIENLLSNAVKFTRERERATIEVQAGPGETADTVRLSVRDNGAGFNPKYKDKLFRVFQRLHNAREFDGTGIGLANVKRIVVRHGGTVAAEGETGRGATFSVTLPGAV